jgi:hypothetical protein
MSKRVTAPVYVPGYLFNGPDRPSDPGGIGPYTTETFAHHGHVLHRRNLWTDRFEEWSCQTTALNAKGADGYWVARVAGITADGTTMQEALDEAWAGAEFEDQLRHLAPPGAEATR